MTRTRRGHRVVAVASAMLATAGLALVGQAPASAASLAPAHAAATAHGPVIFHRPASARAAGTSRARGSALKAAKAATGRPAKGAPSSRLPADVRAVCGTPVRNHAECLALLRTNVKAHKGLFAPDSAPSGYGPSDLQSAYNLPSATAGSGETVAIVDAGNDPTAEADLGVYRAQYGLPPCTTANGCFKKVNQEGQQGSYPPSTGNWPLEESLDIDMVSAICPNCRILLVEANSTSLADMGASVNEAVALGAKFISNSYSTSESSSETGWDSSYYNHPGVAITASAGDNGYGTGYPSASQYVTSVGGTTLTRDASTARGWTETAWGTSSGGEGTGSGCSAYEAKPSWQADTGCAKRTVADVSADADPNTGVAVYDTTGQGGWLVVGGTSVSSPVMASTFALAGTPAAGTYPSSYPYLNASGGLNDVTSGANGNCTPAYLCTAGPGYDGPTGLGTPNGTSAFVPVTYGTLTGTVTDTSTGKPVTDGTITAGGRTAAITSTGHYTLDLAPGSYSVTASGFGHVAKTITGIQISNGQVTRRKITLTASPDVTLSGTIVDGSGHKWPLYATVTVAGTPLMPVYTSPYDGHYSISVPAQATYSLNVSAVYPGYAPATATVAVGTSAASKNVRVSIDTAACDAPGYAASSGGKCAITHGGLVTGVVSDGNTGDAVSGARITSKADPGQTGTSAVTGDPAIPGGFYWLFSSATGLRTFTATAGGYTPARVSADVAANAVTRQDWTLQAGRLTMTPSSTSVTALLGAAKTVKVALGNTGTAPVHVTLGAQDGGFTPVGGSRYASVIPAAKGSKLPTHATGSAWTKIAKYPIPIAGNAAAYDPQSGDVYSVGGVDGTTQANTGDGYRYDPGTGKWAPIAPAPATLTSPSAVFIDGTLYLAGGQEGNYSGSPISTAVYAYTPGSNRWSQVASMPDGLMNGATAVLDGQLYVIGGCDEASVAKGQGLCTAGTKRTYRYDPVANAWTRLADYPIPVNQEACAGIDGQVVCAGGASTVVNGDGITATYLYDPASNTWSPGTDMPSPAHGMAYAGADGKLQVAGGIEDIFIHKNPASAQYDPATGTWTSLPAAGFFEAGGGSSCGMYKIGGYAWASGNPTRDAEVLPGYDQCDGAGALSWLSDSPASVVVAPGQTVTVSVQLNSADVSQPGSYQATLYASADTPYLAQVTSLTMNVKPSAAMREVSGTVTTAAGLPLAGATVAITSGGQAAVAVKTNGFGRYRWWLAGGSSPVGVSAARDGYQPQAVTAAPAPGAPATTDFALKPDPSPLPYTSTAAAHAPGGAKTGAADTLLAADAAHGGRAHPRPASAAHSRSGSAAPRRTHAQDSPSSRSSLPADVKAVCGKPASDADAQCDALVRTNVKPHKGLFGPDQAPSGYGPSDLQAAYNLPPGTAGSTATVAVVDAYDDPNAEADLQTYRAQYGLPACTTANGCFAKVNQQGQQGSYPVADSGWAEEESLDVDMVSAICPHCHILLVEANSTSIADLGASVSEAVTLGAKFISNSYGTSGESSAETGWDQYYNHPGVAVTASAGDSGYGVHYPAASPYVTSVGGTTLTHDPSTARGWAETVWPGTGSGCSMYEPKPSWQADTGCANRTDNDVSADADPNTGVAVYDSGIGGWNVFGGTSVASPVIASVYALAGTPAAGTYPSAYPYVNAGGGLNDVTSGADGTCAPAYLCTAGPGYDGPTGLGTPDGITAFTPATYGTLSGTVTSTATGNPVAGATVTVGSLSATTGSNGKYSVDVASGSYAVTVNAYGYAAKTVAGVQVTGGQTTTQDFALTAKPDVTLSGTVKDGSGHKWPLYAKITVAGTPLAPVYTNPDTGTYSITIAADTTYTLDVAPVYPGYAPVTDTLKIGTKDVTKNIKVSVNTAACDAPGYAYTYDGAGTQFTGWTGTKPQDGWTTVNNNGSGAAWMFGSNPTGEGEPPDSDGQFAIADSNYDYPTPVDTSLVSPVVNLSSVPAPQIGFDTYFRGTTANVDLSLDGGQTWTTVWQSKASPPLTARLRSRSRRPPASPTCRSGSITPATVPGGGRWTTWSSAPRPAPPSPAGWWPAS